MDLCMHDRICHAILCTNEDDRSQYHLPFFIGTTSTSVFDAFDDVLISNRGDKQLWVDWLFPISLDEEGITLAPTDDRGDVVWKSNMISELSLERVDHMQPGSVRVCRKEIENLYTRVSSYTLQSSPLTAELS